MANPDQTPAALAEVPCPSLQTGSVAAASEQCELPAAGDDLEDVSLEMEKVLDQLVSEALEETSIVAASADVEGEAVQQLVCIADTEVTDGAEGDSVQQAGAADDAGVAGTQGTQYNFTTLTAGANLKVSTNCRRFSSDLQIGPLKPTPEAEI